MHWEYFILGAEAAVVGCFGDGVVLYVFPSPEAADGHATAGAVQCVFFLRAEYGGDEARSVGVRAAADHVADAALRAFHAMSDAVSHGRRGGVPNKISSC